MTQDRREGQAVTPVVVRRIFTTEAEEARTPRNDGKWTVGATEEWAVPRDRGLKSRKLLGGKKRG